MPQPQFPMHGYHLRKSLKQCVTAVALGLSSSFAYYLLHNLPRKARYNNFYSTYDPIASFNRMRDGGYLDSCPAPKRNGRVIDINK